MDSKRIDLRVSADRSMMLVVRMTTVGVMSRAGLTMDEMDDMKMAVDEACNLMLLQKCGCEMLEIEYEIGEGNVSIRIEGQGVSKAADGKLDANMQEVIRCILESMVDEVEVAGAEEGMTRSICLKKKVAGCGRTAV